MTIRCSKCKTQTEDVDPTPYKTESGRGMVRAQCGVCGTKKTTFGKKEISDEVKPRVKRVEADIDIEIVKAKRGRRPKNVNVEPVEVE